MQRDAVRNGAAAVISNNKLEIDPGVVQIIVEDTRTVLPVISSNFFGNPFQILLK